MIPFRMSQRRRRTEFNASTICIDTHHGEFCASDFDDFIGVVAERFYSNSDVNGTPTCLDGMCIEADSVTRIDRFLERDALEGDGDPSMSAMLASLVESCLIDQGQNDAAKDGAEGVGMAGHHVNPERKRFRLVIGHGSHCPRQTLRSQAARSRALGCHCEGHSKNTVISPALSRSDG